jgi:hypothetical protein
MKKPITKEYTVIMSYHASKHERMFERVLEHWRKEEGVIVWNKKMLLKSEMGLK